VSGKTQVSSATKRDIAYDMRLRAVTVTFAHVELDRCTRSSLRRACDRPSVSRLGRTGGRLLINEPPTSCHAPVRCGKQQHSAQANDAAFM